MPGRSALAALAVAAVCLATGSAPAAAYESEFLAAPAYPQSRLAIDVLGRPRVGSIVTVRFSGSNEPKPLGSGAVFTSYTLAAFVQNPAVYPQCARTYDESLNRLINTPNQILQIATGLNEGRGDPWRIDVKYQSGSLRRILICAHTRLVTDDAAVAALRHDLRKRKSRRRRR